jgi:protein-S-isoprenylcysteine O-methyltransferase Ste14
MSLGLRSRLWVLAQFTLVALMLAWPAHWRVTPWTLLCAAAAIALGAWVMAWNRPGNFNIRPEPRDGASLVVGGPYRRMRHPMYSALLLAMGALVASSPDAARLACWLLLLLVLHGKSELEERLLLQRWPEYAAYRARTWKFIPRPR